MSREEAIEILSDMRAEYNLFGDEEEATRYHVLSWAIQEMKATQPERKTGRWIEWDEDCTWECSSCGEPWTLIEGTPKQNGMNYCPNCGARMEGEEVGRREDETYD